MSDKAYKISKEFVDKVFPKKDIDIMGYESPIQVYIGQMHTEQDDTIYRMIRDYGVDVDKEELIKALQYDRGQYDVGYRKGYEQGVRDYAARVKKYYSSLTGKTMTAAVKYVLTVIEQEMLKENREQGINYNDYVPPKKGNTNE